MTAIQLSKKEFNKIQKAININQNNNDYEETKTPNIEGGNMKNKLTDLNNYLFEQLERLNDDSLSQEEMDKELKKADSITKIASIIVKNADTQLKGAKYLTDMGVQVNNYSTANMLGFGGNNDKNQENK